MIEGSHAAAATEPVDGRRAGESAGLSLGHSQRVNIVPDADRSEGQGNRRGGGRSAGIAATRITATPNAAAARGQRGVFSSPVN